MGGKEEMIIFLIKTFGACVLLRSMHVHALCIYALSASQSMKLSLRHLLSMCKCSAATYGEIIYTTNLRCRNFLWFLIFYKILILMTRAIGSARSAYR